MQRQVGRQEPLRGVQIAEVRGVSAEGCLHGHHVLCCGRGVLRAADTEDSSPGGQALGPRHSCGEDHDGSVIEEGGWGGGDGLGGE